MFENQPWWRLPLCLTHFISPPGPTCSAPNAPCSRMRCRDSGDGKNFGSPGPRPRANGRVSSATEKRLRDNISVEFIDYSNWSHSSFQELPARLCDDLFTFESAGCPLPLLSRRRILTHGNYGNPSSKKSRSHTQCPDQVVDSLFHCLHSHFC